MTEKKDNNEGKEIPRKGEVEETSAEFEIEDEIEETVEELESLIGIEPGAEAKLLKKFKQTYRKEYYDKYGHYPDENTYCINV